MNPSKTAANALDSTSNSCRRAQPMRQTRINPPRISSLNRNNTLIARSGHEQPIDIFPGVTHFADAITALPKELVRHFTLLKEVDAKIFVPEDHLFQLIEAAVQDQARDSVRFDFGGSVIATEIGDGADAATALTPSACGLTDPTMVDSQITRPQILRQIYFKMTEVMVSLEEKNHVISTANEVLQRQLSRIDNIWPHLKGEFSDEAKWGSTSHWAYFENRQAKANKAQAERSRRDGAAALSAAAQLVAEEAAARSSDRKKAMTEKKNYKNSHPEAEGESRQQEPTKKTQSSKSRKPPAESSQSVGLGVLAAPSGNGGASSSKRRKPDNKANGGTPAERALSNVINSTAAKPKTQSPGETPVPESASKKRKALPSASIQPKKSRTGTAMSPSVISSPVIGAFSNNKIGQASAAPPASVRPVSSRARQNSIQLNFESGQPRPSSATLHKPMGTTLDLSAPGIGPRAPVASDLNTSKEVVVLNKPEPVHVDDSTRVPPPELDVNGSAGHKKEMANKTNEERETKKESAPPSAVSTPMAPQANVTTKSGRASKPSTPALSTFAEAASTARSRSCRSADGASSSAKRCHKKGASMSTNAAASTTAPAHATTEGLLQKSRPNLDRKGDVEPEGDEPRYCYCNGVSYGEMVACDANECSREWFHLECAGLKVAPSKNAKWFCDDCKKRLHKKINGR